MKDALSLSNKALKISRSMQEYPGFPLIFGNYDFPSSVLPFYKRFWPIVTIVDAHSCYMKLLNTLSYSAIAEDQGRYFEGNLRSKMRACFSDLKSEKLQVNLSDTNLFEFQTLDHRRLVGALSTSRELNPPEDLVMVKSGVHLLDTQNEIYKDIEDQSDNIDLSKLSYKIRYRKPLTPREDLALKWFHLHLNSVCTYIDIVILAIKGGKLVQILDKDKEIVDGETSENIHILQIERMTLVGESELIQKYFTTDEWIITDIDLFMTNLSD